MKRRFLYRTLRFLLLAAAGLSLLTACGGGNEDTTPPTITLSPLSETSIPQGVESPTNNPDVILNVKATVDDPKATVTLSANPSSILVQNDPAPVTTPPNISFTLANLVEGANTVTITAEDTAGNVNTLSFSFVLDTIPPFLLLGPASTVTPSATQTIGAISEAGLASSSVTVNTGATATEITPPSNTFYALEYQLDGLQPGNNIVTVTATDAAGNTTDNADNPLNILVDSDVEAVTIDPLNPAPTKSTVTLTGTAPAGTTVAISLDNSNADSTITPPPSASITQQPTESTGGVWKATVQDLQVGVFTPVTVTAGTVDPAGNIGTAAVNLVYNTAPTAKFNLKANATDVPTDTSITATFDQAVYNVTNTTFTLKDSAGVAVPAAVTGDTTQSPYTATLTPSDALNPGISYTVSLSNQITNEFGTKLAAKSQSFATKSSQ